MAEQMEVAVVDSRWNDLSEDLKKSIFARLPVEFVYTYRSLCKEWNALLSSKHFLSRMWAEAPSNKQPWLLLCHSNPEIPCWAFSFYTWTWRACFSLSFLKEQRPYQARVKVNCTESAAGLILLDFVDLEAFGFRATVRVCNPYTRTFMKLERMSVISVVIDKCMVLDGDGPSEYNYKVVALGWDRWRREYEDVRFVEIYDSSERTWKIAGYLPQDLRLFIPDHFEGNRRMVYCDGSVYILGHQPEMPLGIAGFSMPSNGNGGAETPVSVLLAPFPQGLLNDRLSSPRLIKCGSRLLIVAVMREGISIWEFENDHRRLIRSSNSSSWRWQEIAKTPASMWEDFLRTTILVNLEESIECIGVGDHVCVLPQGTRNIPNQEGVTVLVYNLTERSWRWTTRSPNDHRHPLDVLPHNHTSIAFKPFE